MIVDNTKNSNLYLLNSQIAKVFDLIKSTDFSKIEKGKHVIDDNIFYALDHRTTYSPDNGGYWESHKEYIDIQYAFDGEEVICVDDISTLKTTQQYNKETDLIFYCGDVRNAITFKKGMFMILFPNDGHMTNLHLDNKEKSIKKVIFKIKISSM